ncbi:MAG: hypothetical protein HRT57_04670 [Crocinitomicaceae bacterium]|nr:hypothetical protein [Crocinitomicaceae bacterium]
MNFDLIGYTPYGQSGLIQSAPNWYRRIGVRTYLDGQMSTWSKKGRLSFHYGLGVSYTRVLKYTSQSGAIKKGRHSVNQIIELGIGWCFW